MTSWRTWSCHRSKRSWTACILWSMEKTAASSKKATWARWSMSWKVKNTHPYQTSGVEAIRKKKQKKTELQCRGETPWCWWERNETALLKGLLRGHERKVQTAALGDHHCAVCLIYVLFSQNSHVSACGPVVVRVFFLNSIVALAQVGVHNGADGICDKGHLCSMICGMQYSP